MVSFVPLFLSPLRIWEFGGHSHSEMNKMHSVICRLGSLFFMVAWSFGVSL